MTIANRIAAHIEKIKPKDKSAVSTRTTRNGFANRDRKRDAEVRAERERKFHEAVIDFIEDQDLRIADLAAKLSVDFKYLRGIVLRMGGHIKISRKTNRHNAMKYVKHMVVDPGTFSTCKLRYSNLIHGQS